MRYNSFDSYNANRCAFCGFRLRKTSNCQRYCVFDCTYIYRPLQRELIISLDDTLVLLRDNDILLSKHDNQVELPFVPFVNFKELKTRLRAFLQLHPL